MTRTIRTKGTAIIMEIDQPPPRLLLDGATATNLFLRGMPHDVCVEQWILEHAEAFKQLQLEFAQAGSDILYAPTFAANRAGLSRFGMEREVGNYNRRLVALTKETATQFPDRRIFVAGGMSPASLRLEPFGDSSFDDLVAVYAEQADALNSAGCDLFVIETMLSLSQARAAVFACRQYQKPVFVTMTLNQQGEIFSGGSPAACLTALQPLGISGFGFNCSFGVESVRDALTEIAPYAEIPLIAKPSAGNPNPILPNRYDLGPEMLGKAMKECLAAGADIIGGCCGTTPKHIAVLRSLLDSSPCPTPKKKLISPAADILLASERDLFLLDNERIEFTRSLSCSHDMADAILSAEEEGGNVLRVDVESPEEAWEFSQNSHLTGLPVCFGSNCEQALERALFLYHGRCMIDRETELSNAVLETLSAQYGAVIY